jgi:hypothetical protein
LFFGSDEMLPAHARTHYRVRLRRPAETYRQTDYSTLQRQRENAPFQ